MKLTQIKRRSLTIAPAESMVEIFNRKLEDKGDRGLADYISDSNIELDDFIERLQVEAGNIKSMVASAKGQQGIIKQEFCKFLEINGLDRLEGDRVSSLTVYTPKPKEKLIIHDKEYCVDSGYVKMSIDNAMVKQAIEDEAIGKDVAELVTEHQQPTIKINAKRTI